MSKLAKSISEAVRSLKGKEAKISAKAAAKPKTPPKPKAQKPVESKPEPKAEEKKIIAKESAKQQLRANGNYLGVIGDQIANEPRSVAFIANAIKIRFSQLTEAQLYKRIHASLYTLRHKGRLIESKEKGQPKTFMLKKEDA